MKFNNQIDQTNFIKTKFSKYLRSTFDIRYEPYRVLYNDRLDELESKLYKGPYLASALPFEQNLTLAQLIERGFFEKNFNKIGDVDLHRPCYTHQIKAFEKIKAGHNLVVTTGTGSGKTECFMYPIINELLSEINGGNEESGVRAIFLFPLNALVYDQMDRLRTYLQDFREIKFGFYTGKTPEHKGSEEYRKHKTEYEELSRKYPNEIFTREEMKENPPHILFTNYSMLEYLLIRPSDDRLISRTALENLKYIVMDEAHIYRGALGIEIALLMRRLTGVAEKSPQFILTSATLGRGKEDTNKIIDFAETLTTSKFSNEDIVFGVPQDNPFCPKFRILPTDYEVLLSNLNSTSKFEEVFSKYTAYNHGVSLGVNLFELLREDANVQDLYLMTRNVGNYRDVLLSLPGFSVSSLAALVELVAKTKSNDSDYYLKLFDIKYHMFMKAPDGAFVTIGQQKDLSLITTNTINGLKAFKIGICQNCKVPYIMGITEDNILCIDDEIDIDESYADKAKRLEYYLIADTLAPEEIADLAANTDFEKYYICPICGYIKKASAVSSDFDCKHFAESKVVLYKYIGNDEQGLDDDDIVTNNIHRCPICEYKSNGGGVIMGFHVGKDRATTLISQILYESMNSPVVGYTAPSKSLFGFLPSQPIYGKKQFLVFSDSRQQAAFFSKFSNANNDRFLKKALLWYHLQKNGDNPIPFTTLVEQLEDTYIKILHYDEESAKKHAKAAALWELLLVDGRNSGEGLGLFAFKLDLDVGNLANEDLLELLLKEYGYDLTAKQFKDLMSQVFTIFRMTPAIDYGTLHYNDIEEKRELLGYRHLTMYIQKQKEHKVRGEKTDEFDPVKSFLPVGEKSKNNAVKYVMRSLGYSIDKAKELLALIFSTAEAEGILIDSNNPAYPNTFVISAGAYKLHSYKKLTFYKCKKCHKITLYNLNSCCTEGDCDGELEVCEVDADSYLLNNYYRNEYISRPIESIVCEEHTAQINSSQAKSIQERFKHGDINLISCSTTFEMGIDLGRLNTVFMRNVPPTPANYAQRAGRAGRRAETSAFILTFCGSSSHDYTYFDNPPEMIRGMVRPPYFVVDNEKILMRHIMATALSLFFREAEYQEHFASVSHFISEDVADKILEYIQSKPQKLGYVIDNYVLRTPNLLEKYGQFKWLDIIAESHGSILRMKEGLQRTIDTYQTAEKYARENRDYPLAKSYQEALRRMDTSNSLISAFTEYNVIPGYGFPVDNVELHIFNYEKQDMRDEYNLSRNLSIAISEYAPGSEIIVDNKKYTSRYLLLPHQGYHLPATYYVECEKCHTINTHLDKNHFVLGCKCKYCGAPLNVAGRIPKYITPIYGFVADKVNKNTRRVKPFKTYASDVYYIGENLTTEESGEIVSVTEHENGELLVLNESKFYSCPSCGYTVLDKRNLADTKTEPADKKHRQYSGKKCECTAPLQLMHLGYSYKTDIVQIDFKGIEKMFDLDTALSVLYAVLEGISITYNIERNDIGGIVYSVNSTKPYSLLLYDTVSGGAGHVKRLKNNADRVEVLNAALRKVSQDCCSDDGSCYNCLRTYNNQKLHKHLKKNLARAAITEIIDKMMQTKEEFYLSAPDYDFSSFAIDSYLSVMDSDADLFGNLIYEIKNKGATMPDGAMYMLYTKNKDKEFFADFAWTKKKMLLFTILNKDSYEYLVMNQNKYKCYLLTDSFDCIAFVKSLEEN